MDAKEAADAARKHLTSENSNLVNVQLDLEEVVPDPARRDWRVILSFPSLEAQQGQQSAIAKRSYKELVISNADGSLICMTDRTPCAPKSCKIPCTAGQCPQPGGTAPAKFGWGDIWRTLCRAFVGPVQLAMGLGSFIVLIIEALSHSLTQPSFVLLGVVTVVIIGLIAEGLRQQRQAAQRPNGKKRNRRPRMRWCRRLFRHRQNASSGRPRHRKRT